MSEGEADHVADVGAKPDADPVQIDEGRIYTQAEIDRLIHRRLEKERRSYEKKRRALVAEVAKLTAQMIAGKEE